MPKVKIKRGSPLVDMTAMCDVAFLLLTFFILTSKFRAKDPVDLNIPGSVSEKKIETANVATITVDKDGKIFFGVDNPKVRAGMLEFMAGKFKISLNAEQRAGFAALDAFGVPLGKVPLVSDGTIPYEGKLQPGIPVDTLASAFKTNELAEWVIAARTVDFDVRKEEIAVSKKLINIVVKGDGATEYPKVKGVLETLRTVGANKFNLVTSLKGGQASASAEGGGGH